MSHCNCNSAVSHFASATPIQPPPTRSTPIRHAAAAAPAPDARGVTFAGKMGPVSWFAFRYSSCSTPNWPSSAGMGPVSALNCSQSLERQSVRHFLRQHEQRHLLRRDQPPLVVQWLLLALHEELHREVRPPRAADRPLHLGHSGVFRHRDRERGAVTAADRPRGLVRHGREIGVELALLLQVRAAAAAIANNRVCRRRRAGPAARKMRAVAVGRRGAGRRSPGPGRSPSTIYHHSEVPHKNHRNKAHKHVAGWKCALCTCGASWLEFQDLTRNQALTITTAVG